MLGPAGAVEQGLAVVAVLRLSATDRLRRRYARDVLKDRLRAWREANPADAKRVLRGSALGVLGALLVLMIFYPHGLYLLGVVTAVGVVVGLLWVDWRT